MARPGPLAMVRGFGIDPLSPLMAFNPRSNINRALEGSMLPHDVASTRRTSMPATSSRAPWSPIHDAEFAGVHLCRTARQAPALGGWIRCARALHRRPACGSTMVEIAQRARRVDDIEDRLLARNLTASRKDTRPAGAEGAGARAGGDVPLRRWSTEEDLQDLRRPEGSAVTDSGALVDRAAARADQRANRSNPFVLTIVTVLALPEPGGRSLRARRGALGLRTHRAARLARLPGPARSQAPGSVRIEGTGVRFGWRLCRPDRP